MKLTKCPQSHFYDADKYDDCPHCAKLITMSESQIEEKENVKQNSVSSVSPLQYSESGMTISLIQAVKHSEIDLPKETVLLQKTEGQILQNKINEGTDDEANVNLDDISQKFSKSETTSHLDVPTDFKYEALESEDTLKFQKISLEEQTQISSTRLTATTYCIKCGQKLPEEAVYCSGCGCKVYSEETKKVNGKTSNQTVFDTGSEKEIVHKEKNDTNKKSKYLEVLNKPIKFFDKPIVRTYKNAEQALNRPIKLFDKASPPKNYTEKGGITDSDGKIRMSNDGVLLEYLGDAETVIIPKTIRSIGKYAFYGNKTLRRIVMQESIKHILQFAFAGCDSLEEVVFSQNTVTIDQKAFCGCKKLNNVSLPQSLYSLGVGAFAYCDSMEQIVIPSGVLYIPSYCFYSCKNLWKVEIADSVKSIEECAFSQCYILKHIRLSEQIRSIKNSAFAYCRKIEQLELPEAVYEIKSLAFFGCKALNKLSLSMKVDNIKNDSFSECENLSKIHIYEFNDPDISLVEMRRGYKLILNIFKQISPERAKRYASEHNISKLL